MYRYLCVAVFILLTAPDSLLGQQQGRMNPIPNVYLDCSSCDVTYIRSNITFVNYVRDQDDASIYLTINDQRTGGGGREYTLIFNDISGTTSRSDTLRYVSSSTDSGDERRIGLNRYIKIGLIPFVSNSVAIQNLDVFYEEPETTEGESEVIEDPWNGWVFDIDMRTWLNGESSESTLGLFGGVYGEWITNQWKVRTRVRGEINRRRVDLSDGTSRSKRDWAEYWGIYAYSLGDHASVGLFTQVNFSITNNLKFNAEASPAFEYNVFPYGEYQERRFIIRYRITPSYREYFETTVLQKDEEQLLYQDLYAQLRYDRPWGRIDISVSGSNYFHDLSLNRLEFNPSFNIRIIRGLSVNLSGRYRIINDQISLPGAAPSDDCYALGNCQRPTAFDYRISFGLSYTFGSIYNNVVNPRF